MEMKDEFVQDVCINHGVRMHRWQKKSFREYLIKQAKSMGYEVHEEKSLVGTNVVVGRAENAQTICTAHYDTPPRLPKFVVKHMLLCSFILLPAIVLGISLGLPKLLVDLNVSPETLASISTGLLAGEYGAMGAMVAYIFGFLGGANKTNYNDNSSGCMALLKLMKKYKNQPKEVKDKLCFTFFDNEEKGLLGSFAFRLKHNKILSEKTTVINFDCVGKGNQFNLYYFGNKKPKIVQELENIRVSSGYVTKSIKSSMMSMSDHLPMSKYNHVCVLSVDEKNNNSLYEEIHSSNDISHDAGNIDALCDIVTISSAFDVTRPNQYRPKEPQVVVEQPRFVSNKNSLSTYRNNKGVIAEENDDFVVNM